MGMEQPNLFVILTVIKQGSVVTGCLNKALFSNQQWTATLYSICHVYYDKYMKSNSTVLQFRYQKKLQFQLSLPFGRPLPYFACPAQV